MIESGERLEIRIGGVLQAEAGAYADELRRYLLDQAPEIELERVRTDPDALDFGAGLAVILATPAIVAVAQGIKMWLARRTNSKVVIQVDDKKLEVDGIYARDAAALAREMSTMLESKD